MASRSWSITCYGISDAVFALISCRDEKGCIAWRCSLQVVIVPILLAQGEVLESAGICEEPAAGASGGAEPATSARCQVL